MKQAARVEAMGNTDLYEGTTVKVNRKKYVWTGRVNTSEKKRLEPYSWAFSPRRRVFVNSMSDLFHEQVPDKFIKDVFKVIANTPHQYQMLTKRIERVLSMDLIFPKNLWFGVSIEDKAALYRLDALKKVPSHVRWISFEPLLEDVGIIDFTGIHWAVVGGESGKNWRWFDENWARNIRDQCAQQKVAFFMKQMMGFNKARMPKIPSDLMIREYPK